jgi:hypothetical protein
MDHVAQEDPQLPTPNRLQAEDLRDGQVEAPSAAGLVEQDLPLAVELDAQRREVHRRLHVLVGVNSHLVKRFRDNLQSAPHGAS